MPALRPKPTRWASKPMSFADVVSLDEVLAYIETAGRRNVPEAS
jgi:hypothetical protein